MFTIIKNAITQLLTVLLVTALMRSVVYAAPASSQAGIAEACYAAVAQPLKASRGAFTPEVRSAYLDWAERSVLTQLKTAHINVPADYVVMVHKDSTTRMALYGSVYSPDPSILQNYAAIREGIGHDLASKYNSFVIAMAVARRIKAVENADQIKNIGRDYQNTFWEDGQEEPIELIHPPNSDAEKTFIRAIADYMSRENISALDLYQSAEQQQKLKKYLVENGVSQQFIAQVTQSQGFREPLKNAMVLLGQRPAARETRPSVVEWMRHIIAINEEQQVSTPSINGVPLQWPLFPVNKAPWTLLMPLNHSIPLTEADYMWETFQGKHGADRYPDYGPYRDDDGILPYELKPSRWSWNALPDRIIHGGICLSCSKGTMDLYSALGKPACWSGQTMHWNLISFNSSNRSWSATVEQAFVGGPDITAAEWYFNEDPGMPRFRDLLYWAGAEYHLGLAFGMNISLGSYLDTRMAVNIYKALPAKQKAIFGAKLLTSALAANPYNPEVWYRLGQQAPTGYDGLHITDLAMKRQTGISILGAKGADDQYWNTLNLFMPRFAILEIPAPQNEFERREVHNFLRSVNNISLAEIVSYDEKFIKEKSVSSQETALKIDQNLAIKGDSFGEIRMGQRFRDGEGVSVNNEQAKTCFAMAASQGELAAAIMLSKLIPCIPGDSIKVTASSMYGQPQAPIHLVDNSGMVGLIHDNEGGASTMWHTDGLIKLSSPAANLPNSPAWVRFDFPKPQKFSAILIWNHNQNNKTERGFRYSRIYGSLDGKQWIRLTQNEVIELPRAAGKANSLPIAIPNPITDHAIKSVVIEANGTAGNYGSPYYGLSAVKFEIPDLPDVVPAKYIAVSASSTYNPMQDVKHLIDGSGIEGIFHDNNYAALTMWHTAENPAATPPAPLLEPSPAWVRFDFTRPQSFASILIWNHNQLNKTKRGFRTANIYGHFAGGWKSITADTTVEIPEASGSISDEPAAIPNRFPTQPFDSVIIAATRQNGNYGEAYYGLSAVRFARTP